MITYRQAYAMYKQAGKTDYMMNAAMEMQETINAAKKLGGKVKPHIVTPVEDLRSKLHQAQINLDIVRRAGAVERGLKEYAKNALAKSNERGSQLGQMLMDQKDKMQRGGAKAGKKISELQQENRALYQKLDDSTRAYDRLFVDRNDLNHRVTNLLRKAREAQGKARVAGRAAAISGGAAAVGLPISYYLGARRGSQED